MCALRVYHIYKFPQTCSLLQKPSFFCYFELYIYVEVKSELLTEGCYHHTQCVFMYNAKVTNAHTKGDNFKCIFAGQGPDFNIKV